MMATADEAELLIRVRGHDAGPGSVAEFHLKHLLALNLRKLKGAEHAFVPRSYILQGECLEEFSRFREDFKISQALSLVKYVAEDSQEIRKQSEAVEEGFRPEGLWGRELPRISWDGERNSVSCSLLDEDVELALLILQNLSCKRLGKQGLFVRDEEWTQIRGFDPLQSSLKEVSRTQKEKCRKCLTTIKKDFPQLQAGCMLRNLFH